MQRAKYWVEQNGDVQCRLCPHHCVIREGKVGRCGVRSVKQGALWALNYGRLSAAALDPIEKKPLYHVMPGRGIFSIGASGCNFTCDFCQNWNISQASPPLFDMTPQQVAEHARKAGACGVAYTYNEPLINPEFVADCADAVREAGMINVMVTNGYIDPEPLQELMPRIDAWNIDLKSMDDTFYQKRCGGRLAPVLQTIRMAAQAGHVEVTHLMVSGENDDLEKIGVLAQWIASVSPDLPLHLTRYYPQHRAVQPPTDPEKMIQARAVAQKVLKWVYLGNLPIEDASTYCWRCGECLIVRQEYTAGEVRVKNNGCPKCGEVLPGIF